MTVGSSTLQRVCDFLIPLTVTDKELQYFLLHRVFKLISSKSVEKSCVFFFFFLKITMFNHTLTITQDVCGAQDFSFRSLYDQCMMSNNIADLLIGSSGPEFHRGMNENTTHPYVINVS